MTREELLIAADLLEENRMGDAAGWIRKMVDIPRAFITGSRIYGTPSNRSDMDLVIYPTKKDLELLGTLADDTDGSASSEFPSCSLRYGRLNLICAKNDDWFLAWWKGTQELIAQKPVTRQTAVETFTRLFNPIREKQKPITLANIAKILKTRS